MQIAISPKLRSLNSSIKIGTAAFLLASCASNSPSPDTSTPSRLFLQQVTADSAIVKWRGEARQLCLLEGFNDAQCYLGAISDGFHREVTLTGLEPDSEYSYRLDQDENRQYRFRTAPAVGALPASGGINLWLLGDSGSASEVDKEGNPTHPGDAEAVKQGYQSFVERFPERAADLILMLGDNAYMEGTDAQWQEAVFDLYQPMIFQAALWPTIGNHEMGGGTGMLGDRKVSYPGISTAADPNEYQTIADPTPRRMPYLDIFSLPTKGEAGGLASGTEQYYAFNYGNLHVVSLDSQLSARDPAQKAAMKDWLVADLQANQQTWTIVIFHHPPYSKSSHDSDSAAVARLRGIDDPMLDMRREFTEIFEDYGVDMVYSGHSHAYERSYYLHGHRGDSDTFNPKLHVELDKNGVPVTGRTGSPYYQISPSTGVDDKVVYTVAGSAGKLEIGNSKLSHPAHVEQPADPEKRRGLEALGSVLVEATDTSLIARFIDVHGQVLDQVEMRR